MGNDRWAGFGWGVGLGLLLGAGLVGGYYWPKLIEAEAGEEEAKAVAAEQTAVATEQVAKMAERVSEAQAELDGTRAPADHRVQTLDLGKLTFAEAQRLNGQPVRVSFIVDSFPEDIDGETLVDAEDKADASPSVRFPRGLDPGKLTAGQTLTVGGSSRRGSSLL